MLAGLRAGRRQAALDHARQIATADDSDLHSLALAGRILEIDGCWEDAEGLYGRMAAMAPDLIYPRYRLCAVLAERGRDAAAAELAGILVLQFPSNPRVGSLAERIGRSMQREAGASLPSCRWRRWFEGEASWHEGGAVARSKLAVVVIGFRAQSGLVRAVSSLLEQDEQAEIVVVNSGGGDPKALLADHADRLRILNIRQPLYAGAARNVGIDASVAPHVAFLAGDCRARPGWIRARLAAHGRGARGVASAIVPSDLDSDLAVAAHLCLFGARSPQVPPTQALRYGASYDRHVLGQFGYFHAALRISEDTDLARRLGKQVHPAWDPRVQTEHAAPSGRLRFWAEMFGRGRRAARYHPARDQQTPWRPGLCSELIEGASQRTDTALRIARDILKVAPQRLGSIRSRLAPASVSYGAGLFVGLVGLHRAGRAHRKSRDCRARGEMSRAIRYAERAHRRDPENLAIRLDCADLLLARDEGDDGARAAVHLDAAAWLAAFHGGRLVVMADWLVARRLHDRAWMLGEIATFTLPAETLVHERLAQAAEAIGDPAAFELAAFDAMARDPAAAPFGPRLDAIYEAASSARG